MNRLRPSEGPSGWRLRLGHRYRERFRRDLPQADKSALAQPDPFQRLDAFLGDLPPGAIRIDPYVAIDTAPEPLAVVIDLGEGAMALGAVAARSSRHA